MVTKHILVEGKVQGVGFRHHTQKQATALGLSGWVKNRQDGQVEILAQGEEKQMEYFIAWLHRGPTAAQVTTVLVSESPLFEISDSGFQIHRSGGD